MNKKIKKPLGQGEAQKKSVLVNSDNENVHTFSYICNPAKECTGARQFGMNAADYFRRIGGSEHTFLTLLVAGLCTSCKVSAHGGYFQRRDELGGT